MEKNNTNIGLRDYHDKCRRYLNNIDLSIQSIELGRLLVLYSKENKKDFELEMSFLNAKIEEFAKNYPEVLSNDYN